MSGDVALWVEAAVATLLVLSGVFVVISAVGFLRPADFFVRMHPPALAYTMGSWCVTLAGILYFSALEARAVLHPWLIIILLSVVFIIARYVAETALIRMVDRHEATGERVSVRQGFRLGWSRAALRMFGLDFLVGLIGLLGFLLLVLVAASPLATKRAAEPAETRDSARSKLTIGSSWAMYSSTLFMVEASLNGFGGSGHSPRSAVERWSAIITLSARPVKVTQASRPRPVHCARRSS